MICKRFESRTDFYEITLREKRVEIVTGKRGYSGETETRTFPSVTSAQFFVADRSRERQNAPGFREVSYTEDYDGGQRDATLEATIASAPAEHAPRTLRRLELGGDAAQIRALQRRFATAASPPPLEHIEIGGKTYRSLAEWLAAAS